jgi:sulfopyruvate decarboxylase TPP-binding subunit|tara:strand:+ start:8607 stop:9146 length:540 start_codon:yes stop_codon:yes gene_type:complete
MLNKEQPDTLDIWSDQVFDVLLAADIKHVAYVPDTGHARLIERAIEEPSMEATVLTTEEEGVGLLLGAWLGGERGVLLMQSSGVGNCINTLSLVQNCRFPFLTLVTMRGEWAEFNGWQTPMAKVTAQSLELMDVLVYRAEQSNEAAELVSAVADTVFNGDLAAAVLFSQRMIGKKEWAK